MVIALPFSVHLQSLGTSSLVALAGNSTANTRRTLIDQRGWTRFQSTGTRGFKETLEIGKSLT